MTQRLTGDALLGIPHLFPHTERAAQLAAEVLEAKGDRDLEWHGRYELADEMRSGVSPLSLGYVEALDMVERLVSSL